MAKKHRLKQVLRNGSTVYGDEGFGCAAGLVVNKTGKNLFAGAGRAVDKNRDIGARNAGCQGRKRNGCIIGSNHIGEI